MRSARWQLLRVAGKSIVFTNRDRERFRTTLIRGYRRRTLPLGNQPNFGTAKRRRCGAVNGIGASLGSETNAVDRLDE